MQFKLLCLVTLVVSVFAADPLAASLDSIAHDYDKLNQGIVAWPGDYESCEPLVSKADVIAKALAAVQAPVTISPPGDATVKERQQAVQSLRKTIDTYLDIAINVKAKVDVCQPPVKPMVLTAIKGLETGFSTLSTACLVVMADAQSQEAFRQINRNMQIVEKLYSS